MDPVVKKHITNNANRTPNNKLAVMFYSFEDRNNFKREAAKMVLPPWVTDQTGIVLLVMPPRMHDLTFLEVNPMPPGVTLIVYDTRARNRLDGVVMSVMMNRAARQSTGCTWQHMKPPPGGAPLPELNFENPPRGAVVTAKTVSAADDAV